MDQAVESNLGSSILLKDTWCQDPVFFSPFCFPVFSSIMWVCLFSPVCVLSVWSLGWSPLWSSAHLLESQTCSWSGHLHCVRWKRGSFLHLSDCLLHSCGISQDELLPVFVALWLTCFSSPRLVLLGTTPELHLSAPHWPTAFHLT